MCTKAVIFDHAAPMGIYHALSRLFRTDAVFPVIFIRKTAARPAQHRYLHLFESLYYIRSHTVFIRNSRILFHIQPLIDTSSQML